MVGKKGLRYKGQNVWINEKTGEIQVFDEFEKPVGREEPFMITYMAEILKLMDVLGNKKMEVVNFILKNMKKADNTLIITTSELAHKVGVSRQTVSDTLKILTESGIIKRKVGAIMINPKLMNNKKARGEAAMLIRFYEFDKVEK